MQHLPQEIQDHVQLFYKTNIRDNANTIAVVLDHIGVLSPVASPFAYSWLAMRQQLLDFANGGTDVPLNELLREMAALQIHSLQFCVGAYKAILASDLAFEYLRQCNGDHEDRELAALCFPVEKVDWFTVLDMANGVVDMRDACTSSRLLTQVKRGALVVACEVLEKLPGLLQGRVEKMTHDELCAWTEEEVQGIVHEMVV